MQYQNVGQGGASNSIYRRRLFVPSVFALALSSVLLSLSSDAYAQTANPAGPLVQSESGSGNDEASQLSPVTVTARQSTERAKDVPFGISVIDGDELEARRLLTLEETLRSTPGVSVNSDGGTNYVNVSIRGVGSLNQVSMDDGSVGLTIDGVSMSMRNMSLGTLDVERIEVLKGPQGTLLGGNSLAGAINVTTKKPTRTQESYVRAEYGQDNQHLEEAVVSGPLTERLSGRFALRNEGSDHWVDNVQTGGPLSKPKNLAFRGSLLWDIDTGTTALFTAERQEIKATPGLTVLRPYGNSSVVDFPAGISDNNNKTMERYSAEINHDLDESRITSVTAYTTTSYLDVGGYDGRVYQALYGAPGIYVKQDSSDQKVTSQDLRWSSLPNAPVFWTTGLSLSHAERTFNTRYSELRYQDRNYETNSYAVFGEVTYPLTTALKATGGLRHSWDRKSYDATYVSGGATKDSRDLDDSYTTGRMALSYALTPGTNVYGAVSRGYQSGGFSDYATGVADSKPYKPAVSNTAEIGFKTESADRRFSLDGALFFTKVKDAHLLGYDYTNFVTNTINADSESKGAELSGTWRFGRGFSLTAGLTYTDAKITSDAYGVSGGDVRAGSRAPDIPRWAGNLVMSYRTPMASFMGLPAPVLSATLSYQYVGARQADPQNHYELGDYQKVDMRVGVISGNTEFYVFGKNLLDKQYDLYGYYNSPTVLTGVPARGRTLGVGLTHYF